MSLGEELLNKIKLQEFGFTLYGPIPIIVPRNVRQSLGNVVVLDKSEEGGDFFVASAEDHVIVVDGYLAGPYRKLFKQGLQLMRNIQAGMEDQEWGPKNFKITGLPMPFVTDMSFEIDMVIKDVTFTHDTDIKEAYGVRLTLSEMIIAYDWKYALKKEGIRAGISAIASSVKALVEFSLQGGFASFVESDMALTEDLEGGWSIPLIPSLDPSPRSTAKEAVIPTEMEKDEDYEPVETIEVGFDTTKTWYELPILEGSEYPQHWKLESNGETYEVQLIIIPLAEEKYLKMKVTRESDGEILFTQRVAEGICYKIDRARDSDDSLYYKMWFGFTSVEPRMTRLKSRGQTSTIKGVVYFDVRT